MVGYNSRATLTFATGMTSACSPVFTGGSLHVAFEIPTFASYMSVSTANMYVQVCQTTSGTFRRVMDEGNYSAGAAIADWELPSSAGNRVVVCRPAARFDWVKPEFSRVTTCAMEMYVHFHKPQ